MSGVSLTIYKPCITYIRSCLGSSTSDSGSYILKKTDVRKNVKDRPRSLSFDIESSSKSCGKPNKFWKSTESFKINSRNLNNSKSEENSKKINKGASSESNSSFYELEENEKLKNRGSSEKSSELPNSIEYEQNFRISETTINNGFTSVSVEYSMNSCLAVGNSSTYCSCLENILDNKNEIEKSLETHLTELNDRLMDDFEETSFEDENQNKSKESEQLTKKSKGAIPKTRKSNHLINIEDKGSLTSGELNGESSGKNLHETKNMTAEIPIKTILNPLFKSNFGKDVPDNGAHILRNNLSVVLLSVKDRLKTYKNWPNKHIEPKKLAEAGFYYFGRADIVECFICGIKGHNWQENDRPMDDHMKWNRNCPFVRQNTTEHDNTQTPRQGRDICGNLGVEIFPNSEPEDNTLPEPNLEKLGIQKAKGPSHPDQIITETRLATFENWPKSLKQKPAELAAAGFYYLGVGDQTLCFYCGGGLKDWVEEDDPWEQHALWFPKCNFLLLKKTPAFVEAVQNKHKGISSCKKEETEIEAGCSKNNAKESLPSAKSEEKKERNSEESSTLCKICFKNELGVVFLPCGHMVACTDCASALKECAICRKGIQATVRAFLS